MYRLARFYSFFPEYELTPLGKLYHSKDTAIQALIELRMTGYQQPIMLCDHCLYPINDRDKEVISRFDNLDYL